MTIDKNIINNKTINLILIKPIKKQHSEISIKNKHKFIHEFSYYYYNVSKN